MSPGGLKAGFEDGGVLAKLNYLKRTGERPGLSLKPVKGKVAGHHENV